MSANGKQQGKAQFDPVELSHEIDRHNDSQERLITRTQDLLKVLLLLSGGALAVCASFFSAGVNLNQLHQLIIPIQSAWLLLTISIVCFAICLLLMLCYDTRFHEDRLRYLNQEIDEPRGASDGWHTGAWIVGLVGLLCFCLGMFAFCWAAWGYLQAQQ